MNPQSPGLAPDEEDDIEMASMDDVVQRSSPLQNGTKHAPYNQVKTGDHSDSEDDELDIDDEGSRALLGAHERTRGWERLPLRQVGRLWPQVQSIVVEVRGNVIFSYTKSNHDHRAHLLCFSRLSGSSLQGSCWTKFL